MTRNLNIIGAGRVGQTLMRLAADAGLEVRDVASRTLASAETATAHAGVGRAVAMAEMRHADLWVLAVPDGQIAEVARALAARPARPATAVHCSGFHPSSVLAPLRDRGWQVASLHPVMSFADPTVAQAAFRNTWCGLEGDPDAVESLDLFVSTLGGRSFPIRSDAKALYHAAAVFSNNFTTVLQAVALEAWAEAGVLVTVARALQSDLLRNAAENVAALGPQAALTGPAARGDAAVLEQQGTTVADWNGDVGTLYALMSAMAARLKAQGKVGPT